MQLSDFDYHLPHSLIAQTPAEPRDSARLLCLDKKTWNIDDNIFSNIVDQLWKNDVLVVNETKVINARLAWNIIWKDVSCEIFLHKKISETSWDCLVYPGKKLKPWTQVTFQNTSLRADIIDISEKGRIVEFSFSGNEFLTEIEKIGKIPLPPYIKDSQTPDERYQTVYNDATKSWSVAAPTAGLHFTHQLLDALKNKWVCVEKVCLNVWLGTFANVEIDDITQHHMHSERIFISKETCERLNTYKFDGKRIIAVGTTSVRTLESFSNTQWILEHWEKDTEIFIYPWYEWKFVDSIITNFHLPKSTLLMLVSSFAGSEEVKRAYQHAVDSEYRFFSFGDAMWIQ